MDTLTPVAVSQTKFCCYFENSFGVLADQVTVVGAKYDESNRHSVLVQERIGPHDTHAKSESETESRVVELGQHDKEIFTVLVMQQRGFVFAGDKNHNLTQYRLDSTGGLPTLAKGYGDIGIGRIYSSVSVGNLAVFGGYDNRLAVITADTQQVVIDAVPVAIEDIYSLSMCPVGVSGTKTRVLLAVSGRKADYSNGRSDLLDVTPCLQALGVSADSAGNSGNSGKNPDSADPHDRLWQLRAELDAADSTIRRLQAQLDAASKSRQALRADYEQTRARLGELDTQLAEATERIGQSRAKYKRYKTRFRQIRSELRSIKLVRIEPVVLYNGALAQLAKAQGLFDRWEGLGALHRALYVWGLYFVVEFVAEHSVCVETPG